MFAAVDVKTGKVLGQILASIARIASAASALRVVLQEPVVLRLETERPGLAVTRAEAVRVLLVEALTREAVRSKSQRPAASIGPGAECSGRRYTPGALPRRHSSGLGTLPLPMARIVPGGASPCALAPR